jgi:hypothetical protein
MEGNKGTLLKPRSRISLTIVSPYRGLRSRSWISFISLISLLSLPALAQANGGTILWVEEVGAYELTITASSYPLQVGTNDVNALVERLADQLFVLEAQVVITTESLDQPRELQTFLATHETATNKLYYHANVIFPTPGRWKVTVQVDGPEDSVRTSFETQVEQGPSLEFLRYFSWIGLSLVLIIFLFFVLSYRARETFNSNMKEEGHDLSH